MRWSLLILAVAVSGCQGGKPGLSAPETGTTTQGVGVKIPSPEEVYRGLWMSSPERIVTDRNGREVKMSEGLTEYIGRPTLTRAEGGSALVDPTHKLTFFRAE